MLNLLFFHELFLHRTTFSLTIPISAAIAWAAPLLSSQDYLYNCLCSLEMQKMVNTAFSLAYVGVDQKSSIPEAFTMAAALSGL